MTWTPEYSKWRHGGWYVDNIRYPSGAVGCVSNNFEDGKWRIVCDPRPFNEQPTFKTRDAAARAERLLIQQMNDNTEAIDLIQGEIRVKKRRLEAWRNKWDELKAGGEFPTAAQVESYNAGLAEVRTLEISIQILEEVNQ